MVSAGREFFGALEVIFNPAAKGSRGIGVFDLMTLATRPEGLEVELSYSLGAAGAFEEDEVRAIGTGNGGQWKSDAVVLHVANFGEGSQKVTFFPPGERMRNVR